MKSTSLFLGFFLLCCSVGCQQRMTSKLQGRWEGRPDSSGRRAEREAEKYGDEIRNEEPSDDELRGGELRDVELRDGVPAGDASGTEKSALAQVTDWESYDVTIVMDFVSNDRLEMSLDGEQPRSGTWKVVSTSPAGCTIEVRTEIEIAESDEVNDEASVERRRFDLLLDEREGICVGFQLTETAADLQVGALYFRRPEG